MPERMSDELFDGLREVALRGDLSAAGQREVITEAARAREVERWQRAQIAAGAPTLAERNAAAAEKVAEAASRMASTEHGRAWSDEARMMEHHRALVDHLRAGTRLFTWNASREQVEVFLVGSALQGGRSGEDALREAKAALEGLTFESSQEPDGLVDSDGKPVTP